MSDLNTLGLPLRFVKELLNLAKSKGAPTQNSVQPAAPTHPPPHLEGKGRGKEQLDSKEAKGKGKEASQASQAPHWNAQGWQSSKSHFDSSAKGKGKSGHWADVKVVPPRLNEHKIFLDKSSFDPSFGLNGRIIGQQGRNVKWVEAETGVKIQLAGQDAGSRDSAQSTEGLHILLQSEDRTTLAHAIRLTEQLVEKVIDQHHAWVAQPGASTWKEDRYYKKRNQPY